MTRTRLLSLVLLWIPVVTPGCGRLNFQRVPQGGACLSGKAPGTFVVDAPPIAALASPGDERDPYLTPDGLELYFSSDRSGAYLAYHAVRPSRDAPFGEPALVSTTPPPEVSRFIPAGARGRTAWAAAGMQSDLYVTGPDGSTWEPVGELNTESDEYDPFPLDGGRTLWFLRETATSSRILVATRERVSDPFGSPTVVDVGGSHPGNPSLPADESILVFNASPSGTSRIWYATRSADGTYGSEQRVPGIDVGNGNYEPTISSDGCELIFAVGSTPRDLYRAVWQPGTDGGT